MTIGKPKFDLGQTLATPGALEALEESGQNAMDFISRHVRGDWGEVCDEDKLLNDQALVDGSRLLSAYRTLKNVKLWIITEAKDDQGNERRPRFCSRKNTDRLSPDTDKPSVAIKNLCRQEQVWTIPQNPFVASVSRRSTPSRGAGRLSNHSIGQVWDTDELRSEFEVIGFAAPLVVVRRKSDGLKGSLEFQNRPRMYFNWQPDR